MHETRGTDTPACDGLVVSHAARLHELHRRQPLAAPEAAARLRRAWRPDALARFCREAELLRQLNHPNIIQVLATLEALRPDAPVALVDLIHRMLEKDPAARLRSVRLVGAELEALLDLVPRYARPATIACPQGNAPSASNPFNARPASRCFSCRRLGIDCRRAVGPRQQMRRSRTARRQPDTIYLSGLS
ncbi:MAG: hypothetical protein ACT4OZ_12915 [Gemmatimonadota bacterium]